MFFHTSKTKYQLFDSSFQKWGDKNILATLVQNAEFYLETFSYIQNRRPFFPENEKEAKSLYLIEIPLSNAISVKASLSMGVGEMILNNAKKV
jgi:hypothetical protein